MGELLAGIAGLITALAGATGYLYTTFRSSRREREDAAREAAIRAEEKREREVRQAAAELLISAAWDDPELAALLRRRLEVKPDD